MPKEKAKSEKTLKGSSRIKQVGDTHWVLHQQNDVRKYKGFKSKGEAESFAATNPVEKGVKITATKAKRETVKKKTKTPSAEKSPKPSSGARKDKSGKVVSFNAGRAKYSYFFYLDGTSDNAYLATNGADDAGDTSSAIGNAWEDVKDWAKDLWDKFNGSNAMKWLKILGGVALGILALTALAAGVYKILKWSGIIKPKKKPSGSTAKKKTTSRKKKPSTKAKK